MKTRLEMIGNKFGRLTVLEMIGEPISGRHPKWKCVCDCGNTCERSAVALRTGREPSCGCATRDFQRKKHDLTGKKFDRLLVLEADNLSNSGRNIVWRCICACGKATTASGSELRGGHKRSCGCLQLDVLLKTHTKHGHARARKLSKTYVSWYSMKSRCMNSSTTHFKHYGGRGISVCDRWMDFENFLADMGERPPDKSLDRIDVNGNYEPNNCKWSTPSEQAKNQRRYINDK